MYFYIFLLLTISKLYVYGATEYVFGPKIVEAQIRAEHWKILEKEEDTNSLDVFSRQIIQPGRWNVTFLAWPDTMDVLNKNDIRFRILVDNIHQYLAQYKNISEYRRATAFVNNNITFTSFLTYDEIVKFVKHIAPTLSTLHKKISTVSIGKTIQNRDILMVKIIHRDAKNIMFFDAGIHAREWLGVMTGLYLLTEVLHANTNSIISEMNWYIIPCMNPDGYVRSHMTEHRLHRKNMNTNNCPTECGHCGIDLNRNFGYKWGASGTSTNPCAETYGGTSAFSEPEARALRDVLQREVKNIKLYLSIHSYGYIFLYPWGYARKRVEDWKDLVKVAEVASKAIAKVSRRGTTYKVGNTGIEFYPAAGGSDDYAKSIGVKYAFTIEVQGGGPNGFDPSADDIKDFASENAHGIIAMAAYIHDPSNSHKRLKNDIDKAGHCKLQLNLELFYVIIYYMFL